MNTHHTRRANAGTLLSLALLLVVVGSFVSTAAAYQEADVIARGTFVCGNSRYPYVVLPLPGSWPGIQIQVSLSTERYMQIIWASEKNGIQSWRYKIYRSWSYITSVPGKKISEPNRKWDPESSGVLELNMATAIPNAYAAITTAISGRIRRTHGAHHSGLQTTWYVNNSPFAYAAFLPATVNGPNYNNWLRWRANYLRPRPTPKPKPHPTPVVVDRSPVIIYLKDHGKEDGDRVKLYVNGRPYKTVYLTNKGTYLSLPLPFGTHTFTIKALNEGSSKPNTATMVIRNVTRGDSVQQWELRTGQTASMTITVTR